MSRGPDTGPPFTGIRQPLAISERGYVRGKIVSPCKRDKAHGARLQLTHCAVVDRLQNLAGRLRLER